MTVTARFNSTKYRFNATETAEYECIASNKHTFGSDPPRKRVKVTVYGKRSNVPVSLTKDFIHVVASFFLNS